MRHKRVFLFFMILVFLSGLGVCLYPTLRGLVVDTRIRKDAEEFLSWVEINPESTQSTVILETKPVLYLPEEHQTLWRLMQDYNRDIYRDGQQNLDGRKAYEEPSFILTEHGLEDEIFAVLSIPKLELEMPIYLGATSKHMADGAAQLSQTSIPLGGENTNSVIAGHRGWNGASYFLHIHKLEVGDEISITNLWETLRYTVSEIQIIEPYEVEKIHIQEGRDLVTLLSCHPPGSGGKQRYLVICERTENESDTEIPTGQVSP